MLITFHFKYLKIIHDMHFKHLYRLILTECNKYNSTSVISTTLKVFISQVLRVWTSYDHLKLSLTYGTSAGEFVKLPGRESRGDAGFFLFVSCSYCCTYNILVNINLYRCLKMHIRNYFQIFKINIFLLFISQLKYYKVNMNQSKYADF